MSKGSMRHSKGAAVWLAAAAGCAAALTGWARAGAGEIRLDRLSSEASMGIAPRQGARQVGRGGDRVVARSLKRPVIDLRSQATAARAGQVVPLAPEARAALAANAAEQASGGAVEPMALVERAPAVEGSEESSIEDVRANEPTAPAAVEPPAEPLPELQAELVAVQVSEPAPTAEVMSAPETIVAPPEPAAATVPAVVSEPWPASVDRSPAQPTLPPMPKGIDPDGGQAGVEVSVERTAAAAGTLTVERIDGPAELVQVRALDGAAGGVEPGWRVYAAGDALAGRVEVRTGAGVRARLKIAGGTGDGVTSGGWTITLDRLTRAEVSAYAGGEVRGRVRLARGRVELARTEWLGGGEGAVPMAGTIEVVTDDRRLQVQTPMTIEVDGFTGTRFEFAGE